MSYKWNHRIFSVYCLPFFICFWDSLMLLHVYVPFHCRIWVVFQGMDTPQIVYLYAGWWTFGLSPVLDYYELSYYKHLGTGFCFGLAVFISLDQYQGVESVVWMAAVYFQNTKLSSKMAIQSCVPTSNVWVFQLLCIIIRNWWYVLKILAILVVVSHYSFNLHFPNTKALTVWITTNCGKFFKRWEYQTTWPASGEISMQVKKQQLELDMEQQTSSKSGKEYMKAIYCHPAYSTYMQSTSCEMPGWVKHKLESRLPGEISVTSHTQMTPSLWQKAKKN